MKRIIGTPGANNEKLKDIIRRTELDDSYLKSKKEFREEILNSIADQSVVLDCGKSSREYFEKISSKAKHVETLDINDFGDYPDIIFDLCSELDDDDMREKYDVIICLAVLEHCYDPFKAAENVMSMLKPGGVLFGYVPFIFRYHAPKDLEFQDYMRFSRDALSYIFRDAAHVRLIPVDGRLPTALGFWSGSWTKKLRKYGLNIFLNRFSRMRANVLQCSGYSFVVRK